MSYRLANTEREEHTFIAVRITLVEAKTAFAGMMSITSLAIFMASMATFNEEITPSRRLGRRDIVSMVGARGD